MSSDKCSHGALLTEDCEDCWTGPSGYVKPIRSQPAEDERVKEARRFVQGFGLSGSTVDRDYATSLIRHLLSLLAVQPATCPKCGHSETDANGWCMSGRPYIANEPDSNKRSICSCRCVQPAASTPTEDEIDEVQHRADEVVNAAIEWHQSGREGDNTWFDKSEALGAAIDRLLELREPPQPHESDVDKWKRELTDAGWIAESAIAWRSPGGGLWRGPYGAWEELQRQKHAAASTEAQDERKL